MKIKIASLIASLAGLTGCALATATPPRVDVASVQLRGAGLLDQRLDVGLCVYNPNDNELTFQSVDVAIDVAGAPLADGQSETSVRLPPRQSVLVPFAVATTVQNLGTQLGTVLATGTVPYRLHGTVHLAFLGFPVPFSRSGQLELLSAGQALLTDPALATACTKTAM